jgi:transposase InsO family protein
MSDEISARNVSKFNGTNFQSWKFQVNALFVAHGIRDIVDGSRVKPEGVGQDIARWIKDNAKAMFLISTTIESEQLEPLLVCVTAKEMWEKLTSVHEQKSASNKLLLTTRLYEYRMSPGDSIIQHVAKVQNMAAQLLDVGEPVSDLTIVAKILASLSSKYAAFQTAWDSVSPEQQTLNNLQERLIREEARLTAEDERPGAFSAYKKNAAKKNDAKNATGKSQRSDWRKDVECYKCKKRGHFARECRSKKNENQNGSAGKDTRDCAFVAEKHRQQSKMCDKSNTKLLDSAINEVRNARSEDVWITDSGASRHITRRRDWFSEYRVLTNGGTISLGDNKECKIVGEGTVLIEKCVNDEWRNARIENVLYVPEMKKNLFSVGMCTTRGLEVLFKGDYVNIHGDNELLAFGVKQENEIYRMVFRVKNARSNIQANASTSDLRVWHERLGHLNFRTLREMVNKNLVNGVQLSEKHDVFCEPCQIGKSQRKVFNKVRERAATKPGEVFHTDVCGPMSVESLGGARYYVLFKDDATSFRFVYFLRHKSDVVEKLKMLDKMVENKCGRRIRVLRSDNGREYQNKSLDHYLKSRGIQRENSAPYTPEQNGKAERDNKTIVQKARTMLHAKSLPLRLWAEAVNTAVYLMNRSGSSSTPEEKTPYELWIGQKPNLKHLRVFGSTAFVHIPKQMTTKLEPRSKKMLFVGYDGESSNYRVFEPVSKKVSVSRDVVFNETVGSTKSVVRNEDDEEIIFPNVEEVDERTEDADEREEEDEFQEATEEVADMEVQELQQETSQRTLRDRANLRAPTRYESNVAEYNVPLTYSEATESADAPQWIDAINSELKAHQENGTWSLVERNPGVKTIDSKWVFKLMRNPEGDVYRYKARLCARGFLQQRGVDYNETFAPVVRYDSIRVLLALVAAEDLELAQFDIQTAFLHGQLEEEIYMEVPEGLSGEKQSKSARKSAVCKLNKSLYGLKQAPRCWNKKFSAFLHEFCFKETEADQCIFVGNVGNESVYLALFVDDGLIAAKSLDTLDIMLGRLSETFKITIGDTSMFVGMQIKRDRAKQKLFIHQSAYAKRIVSKFKMSEAKKASVPIDPNVVLYPVLENDKKVENVPYREAVGSLMFLAVVSRPDIAFAVNTVSKFLNNHNDEHWRAVKRIISYVSGTIEYGIEYFCSEKACELIGYSDADYANDIETRRSTTGYLFELANGPVTWCSQRQKLVTLSTTESEYVAASVASREAIWLRKLLKDIRPQCEKATVIFVDNQSAIKLVKNPEFHKRTKHIDVRYHYIREKVNAKEIKVEYVPSELQKADIFTKALTKEKFKRLCSSMNVIEYPT